MTAGLRTYVLATILPLACAGGVAAQAKRAPALADSIGGRSSALAVDGRPAPALAVDSVRRRSPAIRIAKWLALGTGVAFAVYGYHQNRLADSRYEKLDRACQFDPVHCLPRTSSGAFVDPELERQFQDVLRLDRRATVGLVGAEIGFGAAVALFLLDLRNARREPPNIPYTPPRVEVGTSPEGRLEVGLRLPAPGGAAVRGRTR